MASAARGESSNPYGGGLGAGGKFRKPPARRSHKTPYDRPPTSVKNPRNGIGEDRGWLSKLVDPAQRLITYSAHRLFASVFRKRLVSGETPLQSPEQQQRQQIPERDVMQETKVGHRENTSALSMKNDVVRVHEANGLGNLSKDGFTDLEKILKDKTFTRSEVDRLTTLLRSKAADSSTVNGDQRNEASVPDSGIMNALVSKPRGSSRALDDCIASPAQLAKAYMCSRPSEVTPSMVRSHGQTGREDSVSLNRTPFPSKSRTMSLVPKLSGSRPLENGFLTPRSRGKSAVYSMARTPYLRPQSTIKNGSLFQASPGTWEESLASGSRKGFQSGLKRRSSVLDTDIESVGPVRRIRQKSNLSSRSLALPVSESPLSVRATGGQNMTHTSRDVGYIPGSNFNLVPSVSRELASKILQQVDIMVSPKKKLPSKLSPSMLRAPALKSLQNVEAPKFLDNLPEKKENLPGSSHQKLETSRETGAREFMALNEKTGDAARDTSKAGSSKDHETCVNGAYLPLTSSVEEHPPKKRAFRMVADEDFDDHGEPSTPFQGAEKQNTLKVGKGVDISMRRGKKPLTSSDAMASTSYIPNGNASQSTCNGSLETGRSQFSALPIEAVQESNMPSEPTSKFIQETEKSSISPAKLAPEGEDISREEHTKAASVFPSTSSSPAATDLLNQNTGQSADIKLEKPSSFAFGKPTESEKIVSNSASRIESTTSAESTLNGSMFSGGANAISEMSSTNSFASSSGTSSTSPFGTNWQAPNSSPAFGSSFTTSSSQTFSFGGSSAATGSSTSAPIFLSSTAPAIPQQSVVGNPAPSTTLSQSPFGNSTPGFFPPPDTNGFNNNQHMIMEDSMAEDTEQANKSSMVQQPTFGQQPVSMPQPATPPPSMANLFQFGVQPIASTQQNASLFQASPGLEFQGGGSFSLGSTGGGDKSGRRIFKAKKTNRKR
ncbi:hypothetical protein DY000_02043519 [Brassica cretica]|uniref:Nuclear pore complex protein NUP1 n=1 Tax=Brassica cretica TaxID=69181 RepID=A0ABQ7B7U1_BRACR|nr:hypothetical protein DY000_02043519 [Brassica cretica]